MAEEEKVFINEWKDLNSSNQQKKQKSKPAHLTQNKRKRSIENETRVGKDQDNVEIQKEEKQVAEEDTGVVINDAFNLTEEDKRKSRF